MTATDESENTCKVDVVICFQTLLQEFTGDTEENNENFQF
jgi:hypothetical protein